MAEHTRHSQTAIFGYRRVRGCNLVRGGQVGRLIVLLIFVLMIAAPRFRGNVRAESDEASRALIDRGRYLVHDVAQCVQCHTPRNAKGDLIESQLLEGAPIPVTPDYESAPWAAQSASLAGLGNYDAGFVRFLLQNGHRPDGSAPQAPMPHFRMRREDARAVVTYLRSL